MRRFIAALIAVVLASLVAMDGVCCPDGCTREESPLAAAHDSTGACVLCMTGVDLPVETERSAIGRVAGRVDAQTPPQRSDLSYVPAERPPRA